jgi:hypothetical protein
VDHELPLRTWGRPTVLAEKNLTGPLADPTQPALRTAAALRTARRTRLGRCRKRLVARQQVPPRHAIYFQAVKTSLEFRSNKASPRCEGR